MVKQVNVSTEICKRCSAVDQGSEPQTAKAAGVAEEGAAEEENGTEVASSFTANVWEVLCKPGAPQQLFRMEA